MRELLAIIMMVVTMLYIMYLGIGFDWTLLYPIVVLVVSSALVYFFLEEERPEYNWFRMNRWGYVPLNSSGWAILILSGCLSILLFIVSDLNSHSVSDTFIRAVPFVTLVLITTLVIAKQTAIEERASAKEKRSKKITNK
ncbi:hypothetical protein HGA91_06490 [candidate division WWE3 bacterium]|nr:hypothetical protein [candidate division WWE3 bacterium]